MRSSHDAIRINHWKELNYHDPEEALRNLRAIEYLVGASDLPAEVKTLRKRTFREYQEFRQAALFAYGIGQRIGTRVHFSHASEQDHDAVCLWRAPEDTANFAPLQLKEVPPSELNPGAHVQGQLHKLAKYGRSADLQVVVHVNRTERIDFGMLRVPKLEVAGLWFVAGASPDSRKWVLIGDLLNDGPVATYFDYPEPEWAAVDAERAAS